MKALIRLCCYVLYYMFARHLPVSYKPYGFGAKRIRRWVATPLFDRSGRDINVEHGADFASGRGIEIGDRSGLGVNCRIGPCRIGRNVMMGPDVVFVTGNHEFSRTDVPMIDQGGQGPKPIEIGDDVWIGTRVVVLPGVRVGDGAILAAGAIVTKDVPEFAIVAGNPARVVRLRTDESP